LLPSYTKYQWKKECTARKALDDNSLINQIDISQRFGHGIHSTICGSLGVAPRHPSFTWCARYIIVEIHGGWKLFHFLRIQNAIWRSKSLGSS
jgi:hypothetical protein